MKSFLAGLLLAVALTCPVQAKNYAVPQDDPAITINIPDSWETNEIQYGFRSQSPDDGVSFYVESATGKQIDKMMDLNEEWMKEQEITPIGKPSVVAIDQANLKGQIYVYKAKDSNGPTNVSFILITGGKGRLIMLTLWASDAEEAANKADIDAIMNSVRPID